MQQVKLFLPLLSLAAMVASASAEVSPEVACKQLSDCLTRELAALKSMQDAASTAAALPQLEAVLAELASMERGYEVEKALWDYIDNTKGVKMPLIELLQRLTVEFTRVEQASFFGNEGLEKLLSPQLRPTKETPAPVAP